MEGGCWGYREWVLKRCAGVGVIVLLGESGMDILVWLLANFHSSGIGRTTRTMHAGGTPR